MRGPSKVPNLSVRGTLFSDPILWILCETKTPPQHVNGNWISPHAAGASPVSIDGGNDAPRTQPRDQQVMSRMRRMQ